MKPRWNVKCRPVFTYLLGGTSVPVAPEVVAHSVIFSKRVYNWLIIWS